MDVSHLIEVYICLAGWSEEENRISNRQGLHGEGQGQPQPIQLYGITFSLPFIL